MATKEKMVDLQPKAEKITSIQLAKLQRVVNDNNALQFKVGALELQKHELCKSLSLVQQEIVGLQDTFSKEYGTFDVDIQDGTINYPIEDEQSRD